jgi:hypothetical protein
LVHGPEDAHAAFARAIAGAVCFPITGSVMLEAKVLRDLLANASSIPVRTSHKRPREDECLLTPDQPQLRRQLPHEYFAPLPLSSGALIFALSAVALFQLSGRDPHAQQPPWFVVASVTYGIVFAGWVDSSRSGSLDSFSPACG